jgi:ribosomal protein S18 acetylase RimI-like enzyme
MRLRRRRLRLRSRAARTLRRVSSNEDLELERIAARGWPGLRNEWVGGWWLRAGGGWTGRANSALALDEDGHHIDTLLDIVQRWYQADGLPPTVQVPLPARSDLREALEQRGWSARWGAVVMTTTVAQALTRVQPHPDLPAVDFADAPGEAWLGAYHYRGGALPAVARDILQAGARPRFLSVTDAGATVAICRTATSDGWLGITAVEVATTHRRRGLATHLLYAALEVARDEGTGRVYLQADHANAAAQCLYAGAGFARHHEYFYFRLAGVP